MHLLKVAKFYRHLYDDLPSHHTIVCKFLHLRQLKTYHFQIWLFYSFQAVSTDFR